MLELNILVTDDKLIQSGDVLSCVAKEINRYMPFTIGKDRSGYRCFICSNTEPDNKKDVQIRLEEYDDLCTYETIPNKLKYIKKEINSHSSETNLILDLTYTESISLNDIDFQDTTHLTPSLKMSNYRKLLKEDHDSTYPCLPKRKIFWITKDIESILLRHFDNIKDIYAFKFSFDDISFDGFNDDFGCDRPNYMRKHDWNGYSDKWIQIYYITEKCSLGMTSAFDYDKNEFVNFTFYEDETLSKRFFIIFDFFKRQAYLLHKRTSQVQTFEYISDGATLELTELMFVHDVEDDEDVIRIFKRQDSLNVQEDQAICEELENVKVYELGFNTFSEEDETFFDYVENFYVEAKQENKQLKEQLEEANNKIVDLKKDLRTLRVARK